MATPTIVTAIPSNVRNLRPPTLTYKPSMWGDIFSTFTFDNQEKYIKEMEALKKEARSMLMAATSTKLMIVLIDKLERLGLAYHFETEIENKLKQVYDSIEDEQDYDLFTTALRFRLLRQHQYHVSCEKLGKSFAVPYYRETVKQLGRAYNQEQKWIMERQMPPFEEYMTNSVFTSCIYVMFMAFVPGMKSVTEEVVQWLLSEPKIVISTAKMGRTLEDLGSHERENREGKLPTVVDCYMNDKGVSKQEALSQFVELVEDGWKDMTEEWVKAGGRSAPNELIQQLLNYGGAAEVTYNNREDGYTDPEKYLGPLIAALYVDPILI
ncbi:hypothetical protein C2S53_006448 [Perilla frutescens var. hirtella]|uniref:Terpene synthase metal-binding domain-containing protein n=1 Tax=Perilla frutescens var. hirtella TaxID=608512 RepID=A0AAD4PAV6_PERFH|nr:hypothetical protein C2S53_006448 [Perilla frutescens var. hirtella]